MKKNSKKKKLIAAAAALALIAAISGTFAWLTAQDQRINRAESAAVNDDSVILKENWEPSPLVAGTEAKKEVSVINSGNANVFVRVSYEEVLKHLTNKGEISYDTEADRATAKYNPATATTDLGKDMPVTFNMKAAIDEGYKLVPNAQVLSAPSTPVDSKIVLLAKGGKVPTGLTGGFTENLTTKIVYEYETHADNAGLTPGQAGYDATKNKYQSMTCSVDYNAASEANNAGETWTYTVSTLKYGYYKDGYKNTVANWAASTLPDAAGTVPSIGTANEGNALLGTKDTRYGVDYDYRTTALGISAIPAPAPATITDQKPIASSAQYGVQADTNGMTKSHIRVEYGTDIAAVPTTAPIEVPADKWVYNAEDGWFYYTSPLVSGQTSPDLLKKLVFQKDMGAEYTNASYDLVVKMEAIQATKEALTDSTGWNLGNGSALTGDTAVIVDRLLKGI